MPSFLLAAAPVSVYGGARLRPLAGLVLLFAAACAPGLRPLEPTAPRSRPTVEPAPVEAGGEAAYLFGRSLMVPVAGVEPSRLVDSFGDPRDGGARMHRALDIMAPRGTPVLAADDGRVLRVSENRLGGLTVYAVDAAERFVYYYAHLDGYRAGLREGMLLARGDVLGFVGTTGNAPAHVPHLHLQLMRYRRERYWDGEAVNPLPYLRLPGRAAGAATAASEQPNPERDERRDP